MKKILSLLFIVVFASCDASENKFYDKKGNLEKEVITKSNNSHLEKRYYPNGKLKAELYYQDSLLNGESIIYDTLGSQYVLQFLNNKQNINHTLKKGSKVVKEKIRAIFNGPDTIKVNNSFKGEVFLNNTNIPVKAFSLCEIDSAGFFVYESVDAAREPHFKCGLGQVLIKNKKAIIQFSIPKPGKKRVGVVLARHLVDEFYLPYWVEKEIEIVK